MQDQPLPTKPDDVFDLLKRLDVAYTLYEHEPIFTVEEGLHLKENIPGTHCRNLFLRDKKKRNFLIMAANETVVDLKTLPEKLDSGRLSFGSKERLWEYLGIRPGSVCPFTMMNDSDHNVTPILDADMMEADLVGFHPLDNAMTITFAPEGLMTFFDHLGREPLVVKF